MPRLGVDEFETDDEWSFISPSAKAHDSRSDSIDGPSAAYEQFRGRISAASKQQQQAQRQPAAGGSQRQSAAAKRPGDAKKSSYTYAHRLPPETRSADGDSYGYATSSDERKSAAGGGGGRLLDQGDWWQPGTRMGQQPRAPLTSGPSSYSSLRGAGADDARVNGHSKENLSTKDRRRRTRARVQEALHVTDGGRLFLESADGYEDGGQATDNDLDDALEAWLAEDESHGFIRVYSPPGSDGAAAAVVDGGSEATFLSRLIPCTTAAEAHEICHVAGLQPSSLHVQLNGDVVRRLDAYERPLAMQNDYLTRIGYSDPRKIQKEGLSTELGYLIRFYSGKSFDDSTYARRQLSSVIDVKTGGILQRWSKRLCAISGTKLTIHKGTDRTKESETTTIQLAKGSVEEVKVKGHGYCIKLSTSGTPQKIVFLSFETQNEFSKWLKKARKATAKLPSSADLSGCNLEFLPESVYTNDQLSVLNLRHNALRPMPTEENIYTIGWLDDISRFKHLRSLNLADNGLDFFPPAICDIISLVELNVATNRIAVVPAAISQLIKY